MYTRYKEKHIKAKEIDQRKMEYAPPNTFYSQTKGLEKNEDMYKFIGKSGVHFKCLTEKLGLDYIWWQKDTNVIELWGPHHKLKKARKTMEAKLNKFKINNNASNFPDLDIETVVIMKR